MDVTKILDTGKKGPKQAWKMVRKRAAVVKEKKGQAMR